MKSKKLILSFITISIIFAFITFGCQNGLAETQGTISLSLTDAPIADAADVEGVFITIDSISYNLNDEWVEAADFEGPMEFNLLELTGGEVAPLADTPIAAGTVSQIRFMLSAPEEGTQSDGNPGCYILIDPDGTADGVDDDDVQHALFVPSGGQTGYKATGEFTVPANGTVEITADFDVRKSVVETGNDSYILKPTIRLIVNNQAGNITGDFTPDSADAYDSYIIFAYEDGAYDSSEATAADTESAPFPNAVASGNAVDSDDDSALDSYTVAFLAAGTYDLIVAGVAEDGSYTVVSETDYADVEVVSEEDTTQNIGLTQ
ncbi:MAG: DUF4382 domain-containing protein [Spirochaetia bacterium]